MYFVRMLLLSTKRASAVASDFQKLNFGGRQAGILDFREAMASNNVLTKKLAITHTKADRHVTSCNPYNKVTRLMYGAKICHA